ncbi:MAG TPA: DUF2273 domain-containing protein [Tepidanaerobacteraceae bacterium]|nr:DUF2273 domain-containing protein [Tepidanaerobacteraceae bacterium]
MNAVDYLRELWHEHRREIIGGIAGLIIGIIIITLGFFKALFVIFCTLLGYYIGKNVDRKEDIRSLLDKILPPSNR